MKYAILNSDRTIREFREFDVLPPHREGYVLPVVVDTQPVYNATTQFLVVGEHIVEQNQVRQTWIVVDKPLAQIDSETESALINSRINDFKNSAIWQAIKNDQDLTANQIQTVIRLLTRIVVKKLT